MELASAQWLALKLSGFSFYFGILITSFHCRLLDLALLQNKELMCALPAFTNGIDVLSGHSPVRSSCNLKSLNEEVFMILLNGYKEKFGIHDIHHPFHMPLNWTFLTWRFAIKLLRSPKS